MKTHGNLWESREKQKIDTAKFNLLPNERLESFWDALWLGIRTFLCFKMSNWSQLGVSILKPVSAHPKPVLSGMSNRFQFIQNRFQNRFQTGFNENRFHRNRLHCKPFGGRFHRKPVSVTGFRFGLRSSWFQGFIRFRGSVRQGFRCSGVQGFLVSDV